MAQKLATTDVVIVGLGWTGSIMAEQLSAAGLNVTAIERGPWRETGTDFSPGTSPDELRYGVRMDLFVTPAQETMTFRNKPSETALPIRSYGTFVRGHGVGGGGLHWNGQCWRFMESDFSLRSNLESRYGANAIPENMTIQDWGISFDDLEPHYDAFEYTAGISGKAGNIKG